MSAFWWGENNDYFCGGNKAVITRKTMQKRYLFFSVLLMLSVIGTVYGRPLSDTLRVDANRGHIASSLDILQGKTAGVTIGNNANSEAMLSSVRVRGTNSLTGGNEPLVIIDGMSSDLRTLASIYPADIESFSVLKDAAQTAQYGTRGAAGVLIVTTHRGVEGKFQIGYSGDVGFSAVSKNLKMMNAEEYRTATAERGQTIVDKGGDSNFQKTIERMGFVQNHHIAFGGGSATSQYRASLSYSKNNTVIQTIGNDNFTAKLDVTQKAFSERLQIDLGVFGSTQNNKYIDNYQKLFYSAAAFNPTFPTGKNSSGGWDGYADASQIGNPQSKLDIQDHEDMLHFNTHLNLRADLGKGFTLGAYGSYSYATRNRSKFYPTYIESTGIIYRGTEKHLTWLANINVGYEHNWENHHLNVNLLAEYQNDITNGFYTTANQLASNAFGYYNLAVGATRMWEKTGSDYQNSTLLSFMGQVKYTALNRYRLLFSLRSDASSKVGAANRWGWFPSVSAEWLMHKESWLRETEWLSLLTLKAGYGLTGNIGGISAYNSLSLIAPNGVVDADGVPVVTMGVVRNANPDLKWEVKRTVNAGLEFGVLDNRVVLSADYYYSNISDMLYNYTVSVPPFVYDHLLANLGKMENQGVEIGMAVAAVNTKDFDFNFSFNVTWQHNRLLSLDGYRGNEYLYAAQYTPIASVTGAGLHGGNTDVVYQIVGQPLGTFYLPHCTGLERADDGTYTYAIEDLNGDGITNLSDGGDRQVCGQATPKVLLGSNFSFRYKQFDLTIQINGAFGHKIYNGSSLSYMNMGSLPFYNVLQSAPEKNINDLTVTDYWLERGDYVNIDYLTLGWTLPLEKVKHIKQLRISASVNNLATITGYSGLTPMINSTVIDSTLGVDDKRSFPVYRTYSLAFNIQF